MTSTEIHHSRENRQIFGGTVGYNFICISLIFSPLYVDSHCNVCLNHLDERKWRQPIVSKMEMMLVGSRELSNDMENGHVFLKMLQGFIDSITLWQLSFLTACQPESTETSIEI